MSRERAGGQWVPEQHGQPWLAEAVATGVLEQRPLLGNIPLFPFSIRQQAGHSVGAPMALPQWAQPGSPGGHPGTCALPTLHLLPDNTSHTASLLRGQVTGVKPSGPALRSL